METVETVTSEMARELTRRIRDAAPDCPTCGGEGVVEYGVTPWGATQYAPCECVMDKWRENLANLEWNEIYENRFAPDPPIKINMNGLVTVATDKSTRRRSNIVRSCEEI